MPHLHTWLRRAPLLLALLAAVALVAACSKDESSTPGAINVTLTGSASTPPVIPSDSYAPHNGQVIHAAVVDTASGQVVGRSATTVTSGAFSTQPGTNLASGGLYRVDFFADGTPGGGAATANGACDTGDHNWQVAIRDFNADGINDDTTSTPVGAPLPLTSSVTVATHHDGTYVVPDCLSFPSYTLTVNDVGANWGPHNGQTMRFALVDQTTGVITQEGSELVSGGTFTSHVLTTSLIAGDKYFLDFYADGDPGTGTTNADSVCGSGDHAWRVAIVDADKNGTNDDNTSTAPGTPQPVANAVHVDLSHVATYVNPTLVCPSFP